MKNEGLIDAFEKNCHTFQIQLHVFHEANKLYQYINKTLE